MIAQGRSALFQTILRPALPPGDPSDAQASFARATAGAMLFTASCDDEQDSARFERVEDRARPVEPGYRHEAPFHVDEDQVAAPPSPGAADLPDDRV